MLTYSIKLNIVFVSGEFTLANNSSTEVIILFTGLPTGSVLYISAGNNHGSSMTFAIDQDGNFKKYYSSITSNDRYDLQTAYVIPENQI